MFYFAWQRLVAWYARKKSNNFFALTHHVCAFVIAPAPFFVHSAFFSFPFLSWKHFAAVGNGGRTEKYEWTQTLQELSVVVPVPEGSKSRDVVCDITKSKLRVGIKGQPLLVDVSLYLVATT